MAPKPDSDKGCPLGNSSVLISILKDYGGNQVWIRISNDIFDSEDVLPVAKGEDGQTFDARLEGIVKKYQASIKTIQASANETQSKVDGPTLEKTVQAVFDNKSLKCPEEKVLEGSNEVSVYNCESEGDTVAVYKLDGENWEIHFY